jgi:hypothetical protein
MAVQTAVNPTSVAAAFSNNSTHAAPDQETAGATPPAASVRRQLPAAMRFRTGPK